MTRPAPCAALAAFRINGTAPFIDVGSPDGAVAILAEAHALTMLLEHGWQQSTAVRSANDGFSTISEPLHADALAGISTLIALAAFYITEGNGHDARA